MTKVQSLLAADEGEGEVIEGKVQDGPKEGAVESDDR